MNTVSRRGPKSKLPTELRPLESHEKYCPKCEKIKHKTDFYKQSNSDRYQTECKECCIKRVKLTSKFRYNKEKLSLQKQIDALKERIIVLEQHSRANS